MSFPSSTLSSTSIFYVVMTIDIISISLTILLLCFTFYHREKRSYLEKAYETTFWHYFPLFRIVKLSSPRMNNLIGLGAVLIFIAVLLNGFNGQFFPFNNNSLRCCSVREKKDVCVYARCSALGARRSTGLRILSRFRKYVR